MPRFRITATQAQTREVTYEIDAESAEHAKSSVAFIRQLDVPKTAFRVGEWSEPIVDPGYVVEYEHLVTEEEKAAEALAIQQGYMARRCPNPHCGERKLVPDSPGRERCTTCGEFCPIPNWADA